MRLLVVALLVGVAFATSNVCRDTAACCTTIDFQHLGNSTAFVADTDPVGVGPAGPWAQQGLEFSIEQIDPLTTLPYVPGLVNVSRLTAVATGSDHLYSTSEALVLSAFEYFPTKLLRYRFTVDIALTHQPACLASIRTLRTVEFPYRQSMRITTFRRDAMSGDLLQVDQQTADWTISDRSLVNEWEFSSLHVDVVRVESYGNGYGAIARLQVCYAPPQGVDSCGVCGGTGVGCAAPGNPCNTNMTGICAAGTLNESLVCVPNAANTPEICNGADDNCNSLIDEGPWPVVTCGVGACQRSYSTCINGLPNNRCSPGSPTPEVCNGIDDDCSGVVDDGGVCGPTPSPTAPATPSATASASVTPSATPSTSFSATPSATPPATPSPSARPREDVPLLLPLATCVRETDAAGVLQAVFGYGYTGAATDLTIAPGAPLNRFISSQPENQPQPAVFHAHTTFLRAFEVLFAVGEQLQWHLNTSVAVVDWYTRRCDEDRHETLEPVQPHLYGCVSRTADRCTATFGYSNTNAQTVQLDVGVGSAANVFTPAPGDRRQPRLFYPNAYVARAFTVEFDCSAAGWSLMWTLTTGGGAEPRGAYADARSLC
jgi:hypothetical protein